MDWIIRITARLFVFSVMAFLAACKTTQGVHLLNETDAEVAAVVVIVNEYGRQEIELTLPAHLSDGWHYEAYPWEVSERHAVFTELKARSEAGCRLEYDRKDIEAAVEPRTREEDVWLIVIDREACGLKQ